MDVIRDKSYIIRLANSRNYEVIIFAPKVDSKLAILGSFKLGVIENFIEVTGVLSSLLNAPSVFYGSHEDSIPLTNCLPIPETLIEEDKSMALYSIMEQFVDKELSDN